MKRVKVHEGLKGLGVALVTPFDEYIADEGTEDEGIDHCVSNASLDTLVNGVIEGGVDFLVVLGTTGEPATCLSIQQERILQAITEINRGRVPTVLGLGGNNTLALCVRACDEWILRYKPDALLSVVPYYNKPPQEGIFKHFAALARVVPDMPIILYNVPGRTGTNMTAETTLRLAHAFPNIIGIKEASGNLDQMKKIINERPEGFLVISGDDALTVETMKLGGDGVISVLANALPQEMSKIVALCRQRDFSNVEALQGHFLPLIELLFEEGNPAGIKTALEVMGIISSRHVELPLIPASPDLYLRIMNWLDSQGYLKK